MYKSVEAPDRTALCSRFRNAKTLNREFRHYTPKLSRRKFSSQRGQILQPCAAAQILKVNQQQLEQELSERTIPLVIDFYATWCGPCLLLAKELEKVAEEVGDSIKILKVDTDENPELSNQLRIEGLPTMVFVGTEANKPAIRIEGLYPAQTIIKIIQDDLMGMESTTAVQS